MVRLVRFSFLRPNTLGHDFGVPGRVPRRSHIIGPVKKKGVLCAASRPTVRDSPLGSFWASFSVFSLSQGRFSGFRRLSKIVILLETSLKNRYFAWSAFGTPCQVLFSLAKHASMRFWAFQRGPGEVGSHRFNGKKKDFRCGVAPVRFGKPS